MCADTVALKTDKLSTELCVTNTDSSAWDFTAALHSYFSVTGIDKVTVSSPDFAGATFLDKTASPPKETNGASSDHLVRETAVCKW